MNPAWVLRALAVAVCLVAVVVLVVDDLPDISWLFGAVFAALGALAASFLVGTSPRRP